MVCIQETKSRNLELALISSLWGTNALSEWKTRHIKMLGIF